MSKKTFISHVERLAPSASEIQDETEHKYYWACMLQMWRLPTHISHFPGANPMSIEKSDFTRLSEDDYLVALKTDGVRHLLMLTTKPNSAEPIAIMIDRTKRMYEIEIWANEDFFENGSLYDGELVWEQNVLVYIVFDVMHTKGVRCTHLSYRERIQILHNTILCVSEHHDEDSLEQMISEECKFLARNNSRDLRIMPKTCVSKAEVAKLWGEIELSRHRNDGLIFTLNAAAVDTGTSSSILKWKPKHSIDVSFELIDNDWNMSANMNNSGDTVPLSSACGDLSVHLAESKLLDAIRMRQPCVVECVLEIEGDQLILIPERERTDKNAANTVKTIEATIRNVRENLCIADLVKLVQSV